MSATAAIWALCDQPERGLRQALLRYVKGNPRTPDSIQADSMLYGELVRHYLQWCPGLLAMMEQAAAERPASQAAMEHLLECAAAYFKETARWPSVPHLDDPLRLLVPACYATRAAQRVNSLLQPSLVAVDFTEPNEFVTEILGQAAFEQISQHKNADFESLARITEDPPPEAKPLQLRSFLHAGQRAQLAEARAAKPEPPKVASAPPPPAPTPAVSRDTALTLSWNLELSDTRVTLEQTNSFDPSYGGVSLYFSKESFLDLFRGHRYRLLEGRRESEGEWKVQVHGGTAALRLIGDDGVDYYYGIEKISRSVLKLNGRDRAWKAL